MDVQVRDLEAWLDRMDTQPLPGGVTAAAGAAAMGAALIVKVARITLRRQALDADGQFGLHTALNLAQVQGAELMRLARHDEDVYRAVLDTRELPERCPERHEAWRRATEIPIRVAEACGSLLDRLPDLRDACWPAVRVDLEIGASLLETGVYAGLLAAESNLQTWGDTADARALRARVNAVDV